MSMNKIVVTILGKPACGKTCLLNRMCSKDFMDYESTVTPEHQTLNVETETESISIVLWDTAGQERYNSINKTYVRMGDIILLAFDDYNDYSKGIDNWYDVVTKELYDPIVIVVATKSDLYDDEKIEQLTQQGPVITEKYKASSFVITSAKSNYGVQKLINEISSLYPTVAERKKKGPAVKELKPQQNNKDCCI